VIPKISAQYPAFTRNGARMSLADTGIQLAEKFAAAHHAPTATEMVAAQRTTVAGVPVSGEGNSPRNRHRNAGNRASGRR
jgi:hypothetical protein